MWYAILLPTGAARPFITQVMKLYQATTPDGAIATKATKRNVTHLIATLHPVRGYSAFRWSAAPDSAVKELQRKGWPMHEILVIPAIAVA